MNVKGKCTVCIAHLHHDSLCAIVDHAHPNEYNQARIHLLLNEFHLYNGQLQRIKMTSFDGFSKKKYYVTMSIGFVAMPHNTFFF